MDKLLELEKKLKEARAMLEKAEEKKDKKHPDEKEDKKLIAEALDTHNEKKHGEAKDKDSAYKDLHVKKSIEERMDDILEKAAGEYGPKIDIPHDKLVHPSKDNGNDDYDYRVHSKTGEVHKLMSTGEHKGKFIPMGHNEDGSQLKKSSDGTPIGEKGFVRVSHTGSDDHGHNFAIHTEGGKKQIGVGQKFHGSNDIHVGSHSDDTNENHHTNDYADAKHLIEQHIKKHPGNYPAPVKKSIEERMDDILEKAKINEPDISSIHTDASINPALGGKYGKIHGGNPKKPTGDLQNAFIESSSGKTKQRVSGASTKRAGQKDEVGNRLEKMNDYLDSILESLDKGLGSKLDTAEHKEKVSQALGSIRQPAKVTTAEGTKIVSPKEQVADIKNAKAKKDSVANDAKAKAEAAAKERRAGYRKEGLLKGENITFDENGQWKL